MPNATLQKSTIDSDVLLEHPAVAAFSEEQLADLKISLSLRTSRRDNNYGVINILVIEDQEFYRQLLRSVFTRQFYDLYFHSAKTGIEAIKKYAEIAPDITFLDVVLPDLNGHDLTKLFITHDPDAFIAMVTANNFPKDVEIAIANKVKAFIVKPFSTQKITSVVDNYFKSRKKAKSRNDPAGC